MQEEELRRRRDIADKGRQKIIRTAEADGRSVLTHSETKVFRQLTDTVEGIDEQLEQLDRRADLRSVSDRLFNSASQAQNGNTMTNSSTGHRPDSEIYNARTGHDFVRDLMHNAIPRGSAESRKRVADYQEEQRLTGMSAAANAAGSFTVPAYLESIYSRGLHPARPFFEVLPKGAWLDGVNSYNIPAVTTPTAVGTQTEFAAVTETDIVASFLTSQIQYIARTQVYSLAAG